MGIEKYKITIKAAIRDKLVLSSSLEGGRYFLYRHIRLDKNEPFYIGIGKKIDSPTERKYRRSAHLSGRNKIWLDIVAKTDYDVEILFESDDRSIIEEKEIEFIALYGRIDLGTGKLANMTNGGIPDISEFGLKDFVNNRKIRVVLFDFSGYKVATFTSVSDVGKYLGHGADSGLWDALSNKGRRVDYKGYILKREDMLDCPEQNKIEVKIPKKSTRVFARLKVVNNVSKEVMHFDNFKEFLKEEQISWPLFFKDYNDESGISSRPKYKNYSFICH